MDLLRPLEDDRELSLTVFAYDSPLLGREPQLTANATATLRREKVETAIMLTRDVNVLESQGWRVDRGANSSRFHPSMLVCLKFDCRKQHPRRAQQLR